MLCFLLVTKKESAEYANYIRRTNQSNDIYQPRGCCVARKVSQILERSAVGVDAGTTGSILLLNNHIFH